MTDSKNTTDTGETLPGVDVSDWPETADVTHDVPDWLIPSRVYDILKWLGLIVLPALALFVGTVGPAWGWHYVDAIVITSTRSASSPARSSASAPSNNASTSPHNHT